MKTDLTIREMVQIRKIKESCPCCNGTGTHLLNGTLYNCVCLQKVRKAVAKTTKDK